MRIAEVIGRVTLSKCHPSLSGATWLIAAPLRHEGLKDGPAARGEPFVIYDELGAGEGSMIGVTEGAEASNPFYPDQKPIDAYNAAILDTVDVEPISH